MKEILRKCVVTQERLEKRSLIRVVADKDKNVSIDLTGKANGRGAYLKRDIDVIELAKKRKSLSRALEVEIPEDIFDKLKEIVQNNG